MNHEEFLKQVALGDREAFHQLYLETNRSVYSFILSILKNPQDAEEVLQETYLKIWISAGSYKPQGKPLAWMFTIARNLCYMKFRDQKRMMTDAMMLKAALEILKEDERQIVLLHASSGLKHREIASGLGMPLPTVLSKYNRAMKKLQNYLREEG